MGLFDKLKNVFKSDKKKQEEVEAVLEKEALRLMKKGKLQG